MIPPCPDPERYILVKTREGSYWRLKRGLKKPAVLNDTMAAHAGYLSVTSKAASRMVRALRPYTEGLLLGRINTRFSAFLRKNLARKGLADYAFFTDYDLQEAHPFNSLLKTIPFIKRKEGRIGICLSPLRSESMIVKKNKLVNGYGFTAVLLYGDPNSGRIPKTISATSPVYIPGKKEDACELWLKLPAGKLPWILFCKVSCFEDSAPAIHARHYAMKVMAVNK